MRRISFSLTKDQFLDGSKTVTRRLGWKTLKPGTHLLAVEKCMGVSKGQRQIVLGEIQVMQVRQEFLDFIVPADCVLEGFPELSPGEFVKMFCRHMGCMHDTIITRIEFRKLSAGA